MKLMKKIGAGIGVAAVMVGGGIGIGSVLQKETPKEIPQRVKKEADPEKFITLQDKMKAVKQQARDQLLKVNE